MIFGHFGDMFNLNEANLLFCWNTLRQLKTVWPDWAIFLSKSLTFLGNFCKSVKIFNFTSEIVFGQLLKKIWWFFTGHTGCNLSFCFKAFCFRLQTEPIRTILCCCRFLKMFLYNFRHFMKYKQLIRIHTFYSKICVSTHLLYVQWSLYELFNSVSLILYLSFTVGMWCKL